MINTKSKAIYIAISTGLRNLSVSNLLRKLVQTSFFTQVELRLKLDGSNSSAI